MKSRILSIGLVVVAIVAVLFLLSLFFSLPAWLTFIVGIGLGYTAPSLIDLVLDKGKKTGRSAYRKARSY